MPLVGVAAIRGRPTVAGEEEEEAEKKGPRGGRKHTPGRDHTRKSQKAKKNRFRRKRAKQREEGREDLEKQWQEWDALPPEVQKLRPELKPAQPRPKNGD